MLPMLMYHALDNGRDLVGHIDPIYTVRADAFARQLDWLQLHGYQSAQLCDALDPSVGDATDSNKKQSVIISFDDGDASNLEIALPLLLERGMTAEFFITSDFIDRPGMLTTADVRSLADAGMGIGSHGRSHAFLEDLTPTQLEAELRDSQHHLHDITGRDITSLALPGGRGGERERRAAYALGYRYLLGSEPGPNRQSQTGTWLQRLPVTRNTTLAEFAALVQWRGLRPRVAQLRFFALTLPKHMLGNRGYERLRARLL